MNRIALRGTNTRKFFVLAACLPVLGGSTTHSVSPQSTPNGHWEGSITQSTGRLKLAIDIVRDSAGFAASFDVPAAAVLKFPLNVSYAAPKIQMKLPGVITFTAEVQGDTLAGTIDFNKQTFPFRVTRRPITPASYREVEVRFNSGDVILAGTLRTPLTRGKHTAIFLLQGSGASDRTAEQFYADYLARRGFATLTYDKRGTGHSTGNWETASFDDFAKDALAGVHYLQSRPGIDATKVGLWGRSHGGMVAPLAASRSKDVAFVINVSGNTMPVQENIIYGVVANLRNAKFSQAEINDAIAYMKQKYQVARTGEGWDLLQARITELQSQKVGWLTYAGAPKSLEDLQYFWKVQFSFDPSAYWQRVKLPVLAIYGEVDSSQPVPQITSSLQLALRRAGNRSYTIKVFPRADHALLVWSTPGGDARFPVLADGYMEALTKWLKTR